jgi:CHAD domain-containing protein
MAAHREIEQTYAPGPDARLPRLTDLPGVSALGDPRVDVLEAVYFDTADFALTRAGLTLRRRTGGADEGWHLKVPADAGRDEIRVGLGRSSRYPPADLRRTVVAWTMNAPLEPIATIRTRRTRRDLNAGDGTVLAEIADDEVAGIPAGAAVPVAWREWELELVDGDPDLLTAADALMADAGVLPSEVQRKIERVLGDRLPSALALPEVGKQLPAARVLERRLIRQVAELRRRDSQMRRHLDEGVHHARIACRRLRSALATYRPLVDREVTDPVRDEIQWLQGALAAARDSKVVRERLHHMIDEEQDDAVIGPVRARLDATFDDRARRAWALVDETLSSDRYLELLATLDRLVADPPWTEKAALPAEDVLPSRVRKEWRRLKRRMALLDEADDRDAELHEVRKDAKRLRYAAEAVHPVWGKDAKRLAKAAKKLTSHLGERQDTTMSRPQLLEIASAADAAGESSVTWGVLLVREEERAAELDAELPAHEKAVSRKKLRRWLRSAG